MTFYYPNYCCSPAQLDNKIEKPNVWTFVSWLLFIFHPVFHASWQLLLTWVPLFGGFMNSHLFLPSKRNLTIDTGKTLAVLAYMYRMLLHLLQVTWVQQTSEQVQASERWVEILGTVQYVDQDSLNGSLVSNKWPPLWNARRVGFGVLIHVYERANLGAEHTQRHTHNLVWSCQKRQQSRAKPDRVHSHSKLFIQQMPFSASTVTAVISCIQVAFRIHYCLLQKAISLSLTHSYRTKVKRMPVQATLSHTTLKSFTKSVYPFPQTLFMQRWPKSKYILEHYCTHGAENL